MVTYHIHITGIVQGVGFRPFVCKLALDKGLKGWVCNDTDGVHIEFNANDEDAAKAFYHQIIKHPPKNALIEKHSFIQIEQKVFEGFSIIKSQSSVQPDLLLTPDIAVCADCKKEIEDAGNSRFEYAFTTCLNCGPRYSITSQLPYDRENTTMSHLKMCGSCNAEYNDIYNRRHYSQTNSCPECSIPVHLFDNNRKKLSSDAKNILECVNEQLSDGKILAVKGIGGYLLLCDATNAAPIRLLRERKQRPSKPFAVMYDRIENAERDVLINEIEKKALLSNEAPIVLCQLRESTTGGLQKDLITGGLDRSGVFLPYTPLLKLITHRFKKPLIATSGNLSGSPIIYKDADALQWLTGFADYIITFDREIVAPQDDSVVQFSATGRRIIVRRSRGLAPNYFPNPFQTKTPALAMGAELKGAFALLGKNLYISQFLGDQESYESQESYKSTLQHLQNVLKINPQKIIVDKHPGYNVSLLGKEMAKQNHLPVTEVQHHVAHFAAVLCENDCIVRNTNVMRSVFASHHYAVASGDKKILGVIWDGTGYGDDGQIWGGEFFLYKENNFERIAHLQYFPQLMGDKMSKEPRLSALALCNGNPEIGKNNFSNDELNLFIKLLQQKSALQTSSMGRFLDGIASLLGILQYNTYEGEAAMKLEALARSCSKKNFEYYNVGFDDGFINWKPFTEDVINDKKRNTEIEYIARKVFVSLVRMIELVAEKYEINKIAFSGGVFQNVFLIDLIEEILGNNYELFFHQQLSPNDECISFGQLMVEEMKEAPINMH